MQDRQEMPLCKAQERSKNFNEVALGYTRQQALAEASRCLNCKTHPCIKGCPVNINIPEFIKFCKQEKLEQALDVITNDSLLPKICGRVCPQENQCEKFCTLGIKGKSVAIGNLERYVSDNARSQSVPKRKKNNIKIALIGSGPSSLSCAADLAKEGFSVTIFEALHTPGGVLVYGIPEFRLPKSIVQEQIENLKKLGVEILTNVVIGKTLSFEDLFSLGYKRIFIATGSGLPNFCHIKGENLNGVYSANEFLTRANLMKAYKESSKTPILKQGVACIVGGGNVAMDSARVALRLGFSKVHIVYRRGFSQLPARAEEVERAKEEGVIFDILSSPKEILPYQNSSNPKDLKNFSCVGLRCVKTELTQPDSTGRRKASEIEGTDFVIDCNCVIIAIGTSPNPLIKNSCSRLQVDKHGCFIVDENLKTSVDNIYAGGDAVTGSATVISAMAQGRKAAKSIIESFK